MTLIRKIHILYLLYLLEIINDRLHQTTAKKATNAKSNEVQTRYGLTQILQKLSFIFPAIVGEKQGKILKGLVGKRMEERREENSGK